MQSKSSTNIKIIDVSHWTTIESWQAVKDSGVGGVYFKATEGDTYTDPTFVSRAKAAKAVGLLIGVYHFVQFGDPVAEATNFKKAITNSGIQFDLLHVLDVEEDPGNSDPTQWVRSFISACSHPYMFYSYTEWLKDHPVQLQDLPLWIANYGNITSPPDVSGWTEWTMWQYSEQGVTPGISGDGDVNAAVSLDAIRGEEVKNPPIQRTTTSALNLRIAPGTVYDKRAIIPANTVIHIDKLYGGWAHTTDGHQWGGWVSRQFLK